MSCNIEPTDKKEFGINVYKKLNHTYGQKNYYDVSEIKEVLKVLDYPVSWECWALVAFMMPANVGEYFRAKGTPVDVLEMKKKFISEMTDGKRDSLSLPSGVRGEYDLNVEPLTQGNLVHVFALYAGYNIGRTFMNDLARI